MVSRPSMSLDGVMQALRQCLEAVVRWGDMDRNPAKLAGPNPPPPPRGVQTLTLEEIGKVATELGRVYGPMIRFAAATGMRPEEWAALERQDVYRASGVVHVARTHVEGVTKRMARRRHRCARFRSPGSRSLRSTTYPRGLTRDSCSTACVELKVNGLLQGRGLVFFSSRRTPCWRGSPPGAGSCAVGANSAAILTDPRKPRTSCIATGTHLRHSVAVEFVREDYGGDGRKESEALTSFLPAYRS